jgi:acylphosphatase
MSTRAVRLVITGRVQAVGYRAWMMDRAAALGLRGWVRNRSDRSVEALAIGDEVQLTALLAAAREGPRAARVTGVATSDAEDDGSTGFSAKPTA